MNFRVAVVSIGALGVVACQASAVEVTGGNITLGYSSFTEDTSFSALVLKGSVELGFSKSFAVQADLGGFGYNFINETGTNFGLHGIYHLNETTSFGAYISSDSILGDSNEVYGVEAGFGSNGFDIEGYFGKTEFSGTDASTFGVLAHYTFEGNFGIGASVDRLDINVSGLALTRYGLKADYMLENTAIYAEIGSLAADIGEFSLSGSERYVGVGIEFNLGAKRGATFSDRGFLKMIPGL